MGIFNNVEARHLPLILILEQTRVRYTKEEQEGPLVHKTLHYLVI